MASVNAQSGTVWTMASVRMGQAPRAMAAATIDFAYNTFM